jgi:hypothetical protein
LARKINSTLKVVTAPKDTEVRVQCPESPKLVREIRGRRRREEDRVPYPGSATSFVIAEGANRERKR